MAGAVAESSHLYPHTGGRGSSQETCVDFKTPKPAADEILPPARIHLLGLLKESY